MLKNSGYLWYSSYQIKCKQSVDASEICENIITLIIMLHQEIC